MQALQEKCETMKAELDEHRDIPYSFSQQSHLATGTYGHTGDLQAAGTGQCIFCFVIHSKIYHSIFVKGGPQVAGSLWWERYKGGEGLPGMYY